MRKRKGRITEKGNTRCKTKTQEQASTAKSPWGKPPVRSLSSYSRLLTQQHQQALNRANLPVWGEFAPVQRGNARPCRTSPFSSFAAKGSLSGKKVPWAQVSRTELTSVALGGTASHAGCTGHSCLHLCSPTRTLLPAGAGSPQSSWAPTHNRRRGARNWQDQTFSWWNSANIPSQNPSSCTCVVQKQPSTG